MGATARFLSSATFLVIYASALCAGLPPEASHWFSTTKYEIQVQIRSLAPYHGTRLVFYNSTNPDKEICLPAEGGSACAEKFVGAVALVTVHVNSLASGKPANVTVREVVKQVAQSPGIPDRSPFTMSLRTADGVASDIQLFGYDESPIPADQRAAQREAAKNDWRRFRQELYLDNDQHAFASIEWLHTVTGIRVVRVEAPLQHAKHER